MNSDGLYFFKQLSSREYIHNISFNKYECEILEQFIQTKFFQRYIIIGIHVFDPNYSIRRNFLINLFLNVELIELVSLGTKMVLSKANVIT